MLLRKTLRVTLLFSLCTTAFHPCPKIFLSFQLCFASLSLSQLFPRFQSTLGPLVSFLVSSSLVLEFLLYMSHALIYCSCWVSDCFLWFSECSDFILQRPHKLSSYLSHRLVKQHPYDLFPGLFPPLKDQSISIFLKNSEHYVPCMASVPAHTAW